MKQRFIATVNTTGGNSAFNFGRVTEEQFIVNIGIIFLKSGNNNDYFIKCFTSRQDNAQEDPLLEIA